jgi:transcription-repair coupling factor (superfamily II helicase)
MPKPVLITPELVGKQRIGQLSGCSLSLALAEYCEQTVGVKLLVAPDNLAATQLLAELSFFLSDEGKAQDILFFPDWETLPYDQFSPHQDLISERLQTLSRLQHTSNAIVITAASTLMHRVCPPAFLNQYGLILTEGQTVDIHEFRTRLQQAGYHSVNQVLEHGEYCVRGAMIDLFPMGSDLPFRIELFDTEVASLRRFDPENQRTIEKISAINILPARECPLDEQSIQRFRRAFRDSFSGNPSLCPLYEAVSNGQFFSGVEYYLPLFFEHPSTLFDYLPPSATVCLIESTLTHAEQFWHEVETRYEQRRYDLSRPLLAPATCFLTPTELLTCANQFKPLRLSHEVIEKKGAVFNANIEKAPALPADRQADAPLHHLCDFMTAPNTRYLLVVESAGRREVLLDLLKHSQIVPKTQPSWKDFFRR